MPDPVTTNEGLNSGALWDEYCETLKRTGKHLLKDGTPQDAFNQAEGLRYLSRMVRAGLESMVESSEAEAPRLADPASNNIKIGADNPDNLYQTARIRGHYEYLIKGSRGTVPTINFATKKGGYQKADKRMVGTGLLDGRDLQVAEDGSFEILISATQPPQGNWLPMDNESNLLLIRQTFNDRAAERPAEISVTCISEGVQVPELSPEGIAGRLKAAGRYTENTVAQFTEWALKFKREHHNTLPLADQTLYQSAGGDPNITYYHGYWEIAPDEAMVIDAVLPTCEFWNFQLDNFWMESLDYRNHRIHLNSHTAQPNEDGSVTLIIAHSDPRHPNWIETTGHTLGTSLFRLIGGDNVPAAIATRIVKIEDLAAQLDGAVKP